MRSGVGPVPETDTTVASQSCYSKVFASGGSFQDVCGELIGVDQDHPVQSPSFIWLTFCGKRFATPQTLIFAVIVPHTSLYGVHHCLIVGSEYIACSNATSSNKTLTLPSANFAFRFLICVLISMFIQEMKIAGEKMSMQLRPAGPQQRSKHVNI